MNRIRRLCRNDRGGISLILAGSLFMLAGAATVAVDLGSIYLARRQLQGVADAAALAAADGGRSAAEQLLAESGVGGVSLFALDQGNYTANAAVAVPERFVPGDPQGAAMRVEVQRRTPLFFGRLLVGRNGIDLRARAIAARTDAAAFSIGTGLASVSDGLPNLLLSALAGTELNLSVMDTQGLASLDLDLTPFEQGAGRLRVDQAASAPFVASPGSLGYGAPRMGGSTALTLTLRNATPLTQTIELSATAGFVSNGVLPPPTGVTSISAPALSAWPNCSIP